MIVEQEVGEPERPDQVVLDVAKAEAEPLAEGETRLGAGHLVKMVGLSFQALATTPEVVSSIKGATSIRRVSNLS